MSVSGTRRGRAEVYQTAGSLGNPRRGVIQPLPRQVSAQAGYREKQRTQSISGLHELCFLIIGDGVGYW
jgi:hypothetical protein